MNKFLPVLALATLALFGSWTARGQTIPQNDQYLPVIAVAPPTATSTPTLLPTNTSAPRPTQESTSIPTPTPSSTPQENGVSLVGPMSSYRDSIGTLHIVGEVINGTGQNASFIKVVITFKGESGQVVGVGSGYTFLYVLPQSQKTCFAIPVFDDPDRWESIEVSTSWYTGGTQAPPMHISGVTVGSLFGSIRILGMITNDSSRDIKYPAIIGTMYNAGGKVIACDVSFASLDTIGPGSSSPFEMWTPGLAQDAVRSFNLQAEASVSDSTAKALAEDIGAIDSSE